MTSEAALSAYQESIQDQLRDGLKKIEHCLSQLTAEEIWWRPQEQMNSIANLLLHLAGNLRQWFVCGLSDHLDERERQREFDARNNLPPSELLGLLRKTIDTSCENVRQQTWETLLRERRVQEFDFNGFQTIADSLCHFRGHVQEIIHITRIQKKEAYVFDFVPAKPD